MVTDAAGPTIPRGYVLLARRVLESGLWTSPPLDFKLFCWLLLKANYSDERRSGYKLGRGQLWTNYDEMRDAMLYYVGARPERPSKADIAKALRRLHESNRIDRTKATRGLVITVCNYALYQTPAHYESNDKGRAADSRKTQSGSTIVKEVKNVQENTSRRSDGSTSGTAAASPQEKERQRQGLRQLCKRVVGSDKWIPVWLDDIGYPVADVQQALMSTMEAGKDSPAYVRTILERLRLDRLEAEEAAKKM